MLGAEQLLCPIPRQVLDRIGEFAPAVIALPGIPLGVLVRENRAGGFKHRLAHEILRSDQFQSLVLTPGFVVDGDGDLRISFKKRTVHRILIVHLLASRSVNSDRNLFSACGRSLRRFRSMLRCLPRITHPLSNERGCPCSTSIETPIASLNMSAPGRTRQGYVVPCIAPAT